MIEVIYKEDTTEQEAAQESFSMPRNVRQIGLANGDYRIYIEDYVYTFLCSLAEDEKPEGQGSVAVLTGEIQWTADMTCIFIKGAIAADGMEAAAEHIDFSEKLWQKLQEDKDQYFPEQEIVGWFFAQPQIAMEITELFVKVHLRHFGGEKILMLMDPGEREDAFFRYDGGMMAKLSGYYIYYEKNSQMQGFYRSVQITGCKSKAIGINIVGIRCSCFVFKNRNIHTHDILFSGFQINFLFGSHQCRIQRFLRHSSFCNDKIGVGTSDTGFYFFSQLHILPYQIQELSHQLVPLILQKLMATYCSHQLLFLLRKLHTGRIHLC